MSVLRAKEIKEALTSEQIIDLLDELGAEPKQTNIENEVVCRTICHTGDSHKLYFFKDSKEFMCYTNCGHLDIINLLENVMKLTFLDACKFLIKRFNLKNLESSKQGFATEKIGEDFRRLKEISSNQQKTRDQEELKTYDKEILNNFHKLYHPFFYEDGITIETMKKFDIRYDILNQRIIIPHLDENGELVAVRCRNTDEILIEEGMKYMPITHEGVLLSAKTTKYFYGLYYNKKNILTTKKVILVESEKAVMQLDSILNKNISLALSSSNLSSKQVEILKKLEIEEVIIALDKEYEKYNSREEKLYAKKIRKSMIEKLNAYFNVSILWDVKGLIKLKESPTDKGESVFKELFKNRLKINY